MPFHSALVVAAFLNAMVRVASAGLRLRLLLGDLTLTGARGEALPPIEGADLWIMRGGGLVCSGWELLIAAWLVLGAARHLGGRPAAEVLLRRCAQVQIAVTLLGSASIPILALLLPAALHATTGASPVDDVCCCIPVTLLAAVWLLLAAQPRAVRALHVPR